MRGFAATLTKNAGRGSIGAKPGRVKRRQMVRTTMMGERPI